MTKRILALALSGLLVAGMTITLSKKAHLAAHSPIEGILRAHNLPTDTGAFVAEARKVMHGPIDFENGASRSFERKVTVACNGNAFIHDQADPRGVLKQIDLLENEKLCRTEFTEGKRTKTAAQLGGLEYQSVRFRVMSFGLVPILKQLHEPSVEAVHREPAGDNQEKLIVKTASDIWTVYVDQKRLIRRIERARNQHNLAIEYFDYRAVDGAQLPFAERIFIDGKLTHELFFTRIALNPSFPDDYFSRDALARIGAH